MPKRSFKLKSSHSLTKPTHTEVKNTLKITEPNVDFIHIEDKNVLQIGEQKLVAENRGYYSNYNVQTHKSNGPINELQGPIAYSCPTGMSISRLQVNLKKKG